MTLLEMKKKVLGLIGELDPESELLADTPDVAERLNDVINQVAFELARVKRIPRLVEMEVRAGELVDLAAIESACGYEVYQIAAVGGVECLPKAGGTAFLMLGDGVAELELFVYPERITAATKDRAYEFELSPDVLEIMPFGVVGDLLKGDGSAGRGSVYSERYEGLIARLDTRRLTLPMSVEGGVAL